MSNPLTTTREQLADELTDAGLLALDHVPEVVNPPVVLIQPAEPYLTPDPATFAPGWAADYTLYVVAARSTNSYMTEELDELIWLVLLALGDRVTSVGAPYLATTGDQLQYLTSRVAVSLDVSDTEE